MDTALGRRCRFGILPAAQVGLSGRWAARVHEDPSDKRAADGTRFRPRPCDVTLPAATVR
jgi:hypothetical protein